MKEITDYWNEYENSINKVNILKKWGIYERIKQILLSKNFDEEMKEYIILSYIEGYINDALFYKNK